MEHGSFLSLYSAKAAEYLLAIGYLLLFIPFWRYVQGGKPAPAHAGAARGATRAATARPAAATGAPAGARAPAGPGWFQVPADVWLHPGHTWARLEEDGLVAVGADDFAHKLVGAAKAALPALGDHVMQGEPALELGDGEKSVPMLSPVDGTVVAVNAAARGPDGLGDPYGGSWLFKVKAPRLAANLRQLLRDGPARRFMADAEAQLQLRVSPVLGQVLQDGGAPVHGLARALSGDDWDETARQFFLT
jgi:glycine cleavage system H lipoate-binding protein